MVDDLLAPETVADPYSYFAWLRADDPVHWDERSRAWVITRYDDVAAAIHDQRLSAERAASYLSSDDRAFAVLSRWMVFLDPPDHTRLRQLVHKAFTNRAVEKLRSRVETITDELLDAVAGAGRFDLLADFAYPLPAIVIAEMLGVPPADRRSFRQWSEEISHLIFGMPGNERRYERAHRGLVELIGYFEGLVERYRAVPGDNLISALIGAEEQGDVLTREEVLATSIFLLFAGHETTANLIGNATVALFAHPDQRHALEAEPDLAVAAVEEFLRYDGPAKIESRLVKETHERGGKRLEAGQRVLLAIASGNRDPDHFADPDRLDLKRADNHHLAFGAGIHFCLGAPLARLEGQVAIPRMLQRLPGLRLDTEAPEWRPQIIMRSLAALPVAVG